MLFVIAYVLISFVLISILFYIIEHSPSGMEDESGFHADPVQPKQQVHSQPVYSTVKSLEHLYHSPAAGA